MAPKYKIGDKLKDDHGVFEIIDIVFEERVVIGNWYNTIRKELSYSYVYKNEDEILMWDYIDLADNCVDYILVSSQTLMPSKEYPYICDYCSSPAYYGVLFFDCTNPDCITKG